MNIVFSSQNFQTDAETPDILKNPKPIKNYHIVLSGFAFLYKRAKNRLTDILTTRKNIPSNYQHSPRVESPFCPVAVSINTLFIFK